MRTSRIDVDSPKAAATIIRRESGEVEISVVRFSGPSPRCEDFIVPPGGCSPEGGARWLAMNLMGRIPTAGDIDECRRWIEMVQ